MMAIVTVRRTDEEIGKRKHGKDGKEGKGKKRVLDAGVHFEVGILCFFGIDVLCFLCFLPFFLFGRFGGAGDRSFGVNFGCAGFWLNVGGLGSGYVVGCRGL